MSCIEYEIVGIEESIIEKKSEAQRAKPLIVPDDRARTGDQVVRRVVEVLDSQLAQGAMPA